MKHSWTLIALLIPLFARAAAPPPIVYTGAFKNALTGKSQLARVHFLAAPKAGQATPVYSAVVVLYLGDDTSREYIGLYYDPVLANPAAKELLFYRDDDARSRRLPTIRLKMSEDGTTAAGSVFSITEGQAGELSLALGWDATVPDAPAPLGGIYDARCAPGDGSRMILEDLELVPSRIFADKSAPEGAFGVLHYMGNGTCRFHGQVSCVNLTRGTYNVFRDTITLHQGGWAWQCRRSEDGWECDSPRYPYCRLVKARDLPLPVYRQGPRPKPVPFPWTLPAPTGAGDCSDWDGNFAGELTHFLGGRRQPVSLQLTSFPLPGGRCLLSGSARIHFQEAGRLAEKFTFPLVAAERSGAADELVLQSDPYTDLNLHLRRTSRGEIAGNWHSRLFGLVGTFTMGRDREPAPAPADVSVQGITGRFVWHGKAKWTWTLDTVEAGFDKSSHDPFVQLRVNGSLVMDTVLGGTPLPITAATVGSASYDYFTNTLVMLTGAILSGYPAPDGIRLRGVSSGYLKLAPDRMLWIPRFYRRQ